MLSELSWLPWRFRRALAWLKANRRAVAAIYRRRVRPPKHRIMISTAFFGGVGGTEKQLKIFVESMPDCAFDIRAREIKGVGFTPLTSNYTVNWPVSQGTRYDLYLYYAGGGKPAFEGDRYHFRKKIIDTNGADIRSIEHLFDHISIQTGNYGKYCNQHHKCIPMFPDVPASFPVRRKAVALPERYFLTVFNPFSNELKGNEALYRTAEAAAMPIVWCFSDKSGWDFDNLPDHPNVIKMKNLAQEELYYVYEHASAYVSFSHMESFGWSLAEAFYLGLPIIAREVGFLTYVKDQPGIHIYQSEDELLALLAHPDYRHCQHDDRVFRENDDTNVTDRILA